MVDGCMILINDMRILVFAGPNGSGKSSITDCYAQEGLYINADEIKKIRQCSDLEAAVEAERLREDCLLKNRSFTFETVLSTRRNLDMLIRARQIGYYIISIFVMTADTEINVFRVKSRVSDGGHDVPLDKIRSRYGKSLQNLSELITLSNECRVYDNTTTPRIIFYKDKQGQTVYENSYWPRKRIEQLCGIP